MGSQTMQRARWATVATIIILASGCARPYSGPKTLAAIGAAVLVTSGTLWVVGRHSDSIRTGNVGAGGVVLGAGAVIGSGAWMASSISCQAEPDCPEGEECKEIPAPPGGVPYKQCMHR